MTTNREMASAYLAQEQVVAALYDFDEGGLAHRLERCVTARRRRHYDDGWPWTCRSAACVWCRRTMIRGWWNGMNRWSAEAKACSLAVIRLDLSSGIPDSVRRLRRALRDVRDRTARRSTIWRDVGFCGHGRRGRLCFSAVWQGGLDRRTVADVLRRRWPQVVVKDLNEVMPTTDMAAEDAAQLGRCRRGVEPLRIIIMPQRDVAEAAPQIIEPLPVLF